MTGTIIALTIAGVIIFAGARIILGWALPATTMARLDRGARRAGTAYLKLVVLLAAIGVVAVIVATAMRAG